MVKHAAFILLFGILISAHSISAQITIAGLPKGAFVIEKRDLSSQRALILWMIDPEKNPRGSQDDIYTCPEETRGSYYSGKTRVSLINSLSGQVINTLEVASVDGNDSFDIPYKIHSGSYYVVPGIKKISEGKPEILHLVDFNLDGKAFEFVLFDAQACMGLATTLIGYSEKQDKVIQYSTELTINAGGSKQSETLKWIDYLFEKEPDKDGNWIFEIDYRGRGGTLDKYQVHYEQESERFIGTLQSLQDD